MVGPNDLEALKNLAPVQPANPAANEAQNRRHRQNGTETPLVQSVDTVQLSQRAVRAAEQAAANRNANPGPGNALPAAGVPVHPAQPVAFQAPNPPVAPAANIPPARAQAAASAAVRNALQNEPEVRPDRVAQAAQSLASFDNQGAGAVNARIAEKLLTGF